MQTNQFDGVTYDEQRDGDRLRRQLKAVRMIMNDYKWHTLQELENITGYPQASISARLRDLRKERFGARIIERSYIGDGVWAYRMAL